MLGVYLNLVQLCCNCPHGWDKAHTFLEVIHHVSVSSHFSSGVIHAC